MLAIRLQRTGRTGHTQFRVIVQDSRFSPTGGRIVAYLGSYNPHTKDATIDGAKASQFLQNGAQPSDRVARLLKKEGIKLPSWVKLDAPKKRTTRQPEKRRSTRPAGNEAPASPAAEPETSAEPTAEETEPTPISEETPTPEATPPAEETAAEATEAETTPDAAPAEEPAAEPPAKES